jgi:NADPH:quinone reductase-like Zn-dependent oxidoreductase
VLATASEKNLDTLRELGDGLANDYRSQVAAEIALEETGGAGLDEVLPLEEVPEAHRRMDSRHGRGKVVLRVAAR